MRSSKLWWSFVQTRRSNALRGNIVVQIWRQWASRSMASWWRKGNIFWCDRRSWRSWDLRSSKWLRPCFLPQFDLLWLFLLIGLSSPANFLAGALLKNLKREEESTFFVWVFMCVATYPPPQRFCIASHNAWSRIETSLMFDTRNIEQSKKKETSVSFHRIHNCIQNMNSGMSTQ